MAIGEADVGVELRLIEGSDGTWSLPSSSPGEPPRWRSLYERERVRAEAAQARARAAEAQARRWRHAEIDARGKAGSHKFQFEAVREKLAEVRAETGAVRDTAKRALSLQAEVARLSKLADAAGLQSGRRPGMVSLRKQVGRLRQENAEPRRDKAAPRRRNSSLERKNSTLARRPRPWPDRSAGARATARGAPAPGGRMRVFAVRDAVCVQRRASHRDRGDRCARLQASRGPSPPATGIGNSIWNNDRAGDRMPSHPNPSRSRSPRPTTWRPEVTPRRWSPRARTPRT